MKAIIGTLLAVSGIFVASQSVSAQQNPYAVTAASGTTAATTTNSPNIPIGVSTKVFNKFTEKFPNATDAKWNSGNEGASVNFKQNGIATRSTFDAKGSLEYTIRTFYGSRVPKSVVNVVRRNGYIMSILQSTEVTHRNATTHLVKMENEDSYITVQVHADGEVSEYEAYRKAK